MNFSVSTSSVQKGESLLDTVHTIESMGIDAIVVRHGSAGAPQCLARSTAASVINAGDGRHEHPTQALLDAFTLRRHRGPSLDGCRVAIVGDIRNSRVARSGARVWAALGCEVTLVGPPTLLPESLVGWPAVATSDLDAVLEQTDVVYLLRIQHERIAPGRLPSTREYRSRWGLTGALGRPPEARHPRDAPRTHEPRRRDRRRGRRLGALARQRAGRERGRGAHGRPLLDPRLRRAVLMVGLVLSGRARKLARLDASGDGRGRAARSARALMQERL